MRLNSTPVKLAAAAVIAAATGLTTVSHVRAAPPVAPRLMATENASAYLEHLRSARKEMASALETLDKREMADRADHRKMSVEHLKKALSELDEEIATYEKDLKDGK